MKKIIFLIMAAGFCLILYGCGGTDSAAGGGQAVSIQDMAMDMGKESGIQPGGVSGETGTAAGTEGSIPEAAQPAATPETSQSVAALAAGNIHNRALEEIKDYLAQYPDSLEELSEAECYVVLHGQEYSGREYLDSFMGNVQAEVPDELVIAQFTEEGDPILTYLNYNAENVYRVEDVSRDAWAGNGEKYFEREYDSVWLSGEGDTEGNYWLSLYALWEEDMVVEEFSAKTDDPLMCRLPLAESPAPDPQTESKQPQIEKLPGELP